MRSLLVAILLVTAATDARADCAEGPSYGASVEDGTPSSVSLNVGQGDADQVCGGAAVMLRQNIDSGEVVQLAAFCDGALYVDECVPDGRYRYGYAVPFPCEGGCSGTPFFDVVTVTDSGSDCVRAGSDAGPTPYAGAVPWKSPTGASATTSIDLVCAAGFGCNAGGATRVRMLDVLAFLGAVAWCVHRRRRA